MNPILQFTLKLSLVLIILFSIHVGVLTITGNSVFENHIVASYIINFLLALFIYTILYIRRIPQHSVLGFLFMAGSMLKFIVFFSLFSPWFKQDGLISKLEFASFFIPYIACLVYESIALSKLLNSN